METVFDNFLQLLSIFVSFCPFLTVVDCFWPLLTIFGRISYTYEKADCWQHAEFLLSFTKF